VGVIAVAEEEEIERKKVDVRDEVFSMLGLHPPGARGHARPHASGGGHHLHAN
jgi:hypothetical protein